MHVPYGDPAAQTILLSFLQHFRPDIAVIAGDLLDFYPLSPFDKDPRRRFELSRELKVAQEYLAAIDAVLPKRAERVLIGGNHEDRLRRYLWRSAPELENLPELEVETLLGLEERGWRWLPYYDAVTACGSPGYNCHGILITHGVMARKWSCYSARAHFERFHCNGVHGHTHRQGSYFFRAYGGEWQWIEAGCQCKLEPPYSPSPDWQSGFVAGYIWDEPGDLTPRFDLRPVVVHNGKAAWEGKLFRA